MKKKVLLISPFFFPELISTGKYNTKLVEGIVEAGLDAEVLCYHPFYPNWKVSVTKAQLNGVYLTRGGRYLRFPTNPILRRLVLEASFFVFVLLNIQRIRQHHGHLILVSPPTVFAFLVTIVAPKTTTTVGIVHDLQGIYVDYKANFVRRILSRLVATIESKTLASFDICVFLSEQMREAATKKYSLDTTNMRVHYPFTTLQPKIPTTYSLKGILPNNKQHLIYSGALGEKQAAAQLATILGVAADKLGPHVESHIFSEGPEFEKLVANRTNYPGVRFHPLVPEELLQELLRRSAIQFIPQAAGTSDGSLPSKLPNIIASACKVLCITDKGGDLDHLVSKYTLGRCIYDWNDQASIIFAIDDLLNIEGILTVDDQLLLDKFSRQHLIETLFLDTE